MESKPARMQALNPAVPKLMRVHSLLRSLFNQRIKNIKLWIILFGLSLRVPVFRPNCVHDLAGGASAFVPSNPLADLAI